MRLLSVALKGTRDLTGSKAIMIDDRKENIHRQLTFKGAIVFLLDRTVSAKKLYDRLLASYCRLSVCLRHYCHSIVAASGSV